MKRMMALFLTCSSLLWADDWCLSQKRGGLKEFVNLEVAVAEIDGRKIAIIQSKVLSSRGGTDVTTSYWRMRGEGWESATKTTQLFHRDGASRSKKTYEDSDLKWIPLRDSPIGPWKTALARAAALLRGK
jgi:hypothetical protein